MENGKKKTKRLEASKLNKFNFVSTIEPLGYIIEPEFHFAPKRRFRTDWKVSKNGKSCLVEYEGLVSQKSRHRTLSGFTNDCAKYNLAQLLGFVVLRYTLFNFDNVIKDLEKFFN